MADFSHQFIRTSHFVEAWTLEQRRLVLISEEAYGENVCPRARVPRLPLLLDLTTHTHIYWQWMSSCVALRNCTPQHLLPEGLSAGSTAILRGEWSVTVPCAFSQIHQSLVISISMRELWIIEQPRRGSWFNFNDVKNAVNKQQRSLRCLSRIAFSHLSVSWTSRGKEEGHWGYSHGNRISLSCEPLPRYAGWKMASVLIKKL